VVLRRAVGTWPRRVLLAGTLLLGVAAAVALAVLLPPAERTFAALAFPVQSLMSVLVPFLGVLMVGDLRRAPHPVAPTLLAAALLAAAVGAAGALACAGALAVAPDAAGQPWQGVAGVVLGCVLVQVLAQSVGTGLGLLLRSPVVACAATIVLPLGLWFLLGVDDAVRPAREWLTPFATIGDLLSGATTALQWVQWLVVALLWGVLLNAVGVARLRRSVPAGSRGASA